MNYNDLNAANAFCLKDQMLLPHFYLNHNDPNFPFDFSTNHFIDPQLDTAAQFAWNRTGNSNTSGDSFETSTSSDTSTRATSPPIALNNDAVESLSPGERLEDVEGAKRDGVIDDEATLKPQPTVKNKVGAKRGKKPGRRPHSEQDRPKKPDETYIVLIGQAISAHSNNRATLNEIYAWLKSHYDFFNGPYDGWKNSIRHNLSLNQCFTKLEKSAGNTRAGKGHYWSLSPNFSLEKATQEAKQQRFKLPLPVSKKPKISTIRGRPKSFGQYGAFPNDDKVMVDRFPSEPCRQATTANPFIDAQVAANNNNQFLENPSFALNEYQNYLLPGAPFGYPMPGSFHGIWPTGQTMDINQAGLLMPIQPQMDTYTQTWGPKATSTVNEATTSQMPSVPTEFKPKTDLLEPKIEKVSSPLENAPPTGIPGIDSIYTAGPSTSIAGDFSINQQVYPYTNFVDFHPNIINGEFGVDTSSMNVFNLGQLDTFSSQSQIQYELVSNSDSSHF